MLHNLKLFEALLSNFLGNQLDDLNSENDIRLIGMNCFINFAVFSFPQKLERKDKLILTVPFFIVKRNQLDLFFSLFLALHSIETLFILFVTYQQLIID